MTGAWRVRHNNTAVRMYFTNGALRQRRQGSRRMESAQSQRRRMKFRMYRGRRRQRGVLDGAPLRTTQRWNVYLFWPGVERNTLYGTTETALRDVPTTGSDARGPTGDGSIRQGRASRSVVLNYLMAGSRRSLLRAPGAAHRVYCHAIYTESETRCTATWGCTFEDVSKSGIARMW